MAKKTNKYTIIVLIASVVSMLGLWAFQLHFSTATVALKGEQLEVLVAKTPKQLFRGLGQRESLAPYDGMLFLFGRPKKQGIVMRDMSFSIDIVWLNQGEVVDIAPSVPLELSGATERDFMVYRPRKDANSVLELPAGWAEAHDLVIGDRLEVIAE